MGKILNTVWINGRFLTRKVTGVERVAIEMLSALCASYLDNDASMILNQQRVVFKIVVPNHVSITVPEALAKLPIVRYGRFTGHVWEQVDLARLAPQELLISLCNTAPILRCRQAVFIHDAQVFAIPQNFSRSFRWWYQLMIRAITHRAQYLFTNSNFSKQELCAYVGQRAAAFKVLHLGADHIDRIHPALDSATAAQIPTAPFILAVSSANPNKNFGYIVQALKQMGADAPPCVIVGQTYSKVFADHGLDESSVCKLGYVSDETLVALYQRAMCLVFPSFYEGFGLPPLESMRCGSVVIASNVSSIPEVCGDAALYCDPNDVETLIAQIKSIQHDPKLRDHYHTLGLQHAHTFTWQHTTQQLLFALEQRDTTTQ